MSLDKKDIIYKEFEALNGLRILVLGDVMIDSYLWGNVERMSPEAPVPVVSVQKREKRLGGAANVALNLKALGCEPIVVSVIGADRDGEEMIELFKENGLSTEGLVNSKSRITTIKHRIISDKHLLRVDSEQTDLISQELTSKVKEVYSEQITDAKCVIFQDYDKGVLSEDLIKYCIELSNKYAVPSTADPKRKNFHFYGGVTLFKPNLKEINEALDLNNDGEEIAKISEAARIFIERNRINNALITLSEHGAVLVNKDESNHIKAHKRNIRDVSGAGDTVISVASAFLASNTKLEKVLNYSNLAGGLVCEEVGVVSINRDRLISEVLQLFH